MSAEEVGKALVARVLAGGAKDYAKARSRKVEPDDLVGSARLLWVALEEYQQKYHSLPSADVLRMKTGVLLPSADMSTPLNFYINEVFDSALLRHIAGGADQILRQAQTDKKGRALHRAFEELLVKYKSKSVESEQILGLSDVAPQVSSHYDRMEAGERGILAPWGKMNDATLGWWPEDLILFAARMAVGKTWMMILLMLHAWQNGKKVLFASTEMSILKLAIRFVAIEAKLNYRLFTRGQLSAPDRERFRTRIKELEGRNGIGFVGGDFDYTADALEGAILAEDPDLVVGDGAYLFKAPGKDRTERAANAFNELKTVAKRTKKPIIISSQFNRDAVKGNHGSNGKTKGKGASSEDSLRLDNLALTDVAGWNTDVVYALHQTPEMRQDKRMLAKCLKLREGDPQDVLMHWDLDRMEFGEVASTDGEGSEDLSTGVPVDDDTVDGATIPFLP